MSMKQNVSTKFGFISVFPLLTIILLGISFIYKIFLGKINKLMVWKKRDKGIRGKGFVWIDFTHNKLQPCHYIHIVTSW